MSALLLESHELWNALFPFLRMFSRFFLKFSVSDVKLKDGSLFDANSPSPLNRMWGFFLLCFQDFVVDFYLVLTLTTPLLSFKEEKKAFHWLIWGGTHLVIPPSELSNYTHKTCVGEGEEKVPNNVHVCRSCISPDSSIMCTLSQWLYEEQEKDSWANFPLCSDQ